MCSKRVPFPGNLQPFHAHPLWCQTLTQGRQVQLSQTENTTQISRKLQNIATLPLPSLVSLHATLKIGHKNPGDIALGAHISYCSIGIEFAMNIHGGLLP